MARFAIADIHGCLLTFKALIAQLNLTKYDTLFLLGDYVNKGPESKAVLDYIIELQKEGFQVKCLRGNHDQFIIDAADKGDAAVSLPAEDRVLTLQSFGVTKLSEIPEQYISLLREMPLLIALDDFVLVHGGLDFSLTDPLKTTQTDMLNLKKMNPDIRKIAGRQLIHGHLPTPLSEVKQAVKYKAAAIGLDGGGVYYKNEELGKLLALNLDTNLLFSQKNIEKQYPVKLKE